MIRNLIFDFGKVLVDYDFPTLFRRLVPDDARREVFVSLVNSPEIIHMVDRGLQTFEEVMADIAREHPDYEEEILAFSARKPEVVTGEVPGMRELLAKLKGEGFRLYGLTNWDTQIYATVSGFGVFQLLDGMVISSEEHFYKPEPEIYQRLFEKFSLEPGECIFADDKVENVEGGRRLGMEGIVFRDAVQYESELPRFL